MIGFGNDAQSPRCFEDLACVPGTGQQQKLRELETTKVQDDLPDGTRAGKKLKLLEVHVEVAVFHKGVDHTGIWKTTEIGI